jgi:hypothetical protein
MTGRWGDDSDRAIHQLAAAGGEPALVALAIVAAQLRGRDNTARQWTAADRIHEDWIPETDWRWISGLGARHLAAVAPPRPTLRIVGAYWAAYDEIRELVRRERRPAALTAGQRAAIAAGRTAPGGLAWQGR